MKRIALRALLFLLLGAAINIAVAWGVALCFPNWTSQSHHFDESRGWLWTQYRGPGITNVVVTPLTEDDVALRAQWHPFSKDLPAWASQTPEGDAVSPRGLFGTTAFGWPVLSLSYSWSFDGDVRRPVVSVQWPGWAVTNLPARPLYWAFLLGSAFWSVTTFSLSVLWHWLLREYRGRRGRCPQCAYPIGKSSLCTECGNPVTPRPAAPA